MSRPSRGPRSRDRPGRRSRQLRRGCAAGRGGRARDRGREGRRLRPRGGRRRGGAGRARAAAASPWSPWTKRRGAARPGVSDADPGAGRRPRTPREARRRSRAAWSACCTRRGTRPCWPRRRAARSGPLAVQVEVDTGMSRMGVAAEDAWPCCAPWPESPRWPWRASYTHLARADEDELEPTRDQLRSLRGVLAMRASGRRSRRSSTRRTPPACWLGAELKAARRSSTRVRPGLAALRRAARRRTALQRCSR